jgi:peptidoglycan/LPS O-acetylase OafA/YrhL
MEKQPGLLGVDILKHLLALCVIIQHMTSRARYSPATNSRIAHAAFFAQWAVLVFFLIAGYFFRLKRESGFFPTLSTHIQRYAKRLLVPFFFFSILYTFAMHALGKVELRDAWIAIVTLHGVGMQMYFLSFLFLVVLIAALVQIFSGFSYRRELALLLLMQTVLIALAMHFPTSSVTGESYYLLPLYLLSFLFGRLLALVQQHHAEKVAFLFGGIVLLCCALALRDVRFCFIAAGVAAFGIALYLSLFLPSRRAPGSGGVYLLHTPVVNFGLSVLLMKLGIVEWPNAVLSVVATYILCLAFTLWFIKARPGIRWMLLE